MSGTLPSKPSACNFSSQTISKKPLRQLTQDQVVKKWTLNGKLERSTWLADGEDHVLAVSGAQMVLERLYEDSD